MVQKIHSDNVFELSNTKDDEDEDELYIIFPEKYMSSGISEIEHS